LDIGTDEVIPILDVLGISLSHEEGERGLVGRAVGWQAALPVFRQESRLGDGIDIRGERERDDIGLEPVNDRAGLFRRASVGLVELDLLAGFFLPVFREGGVELGVELPRGVVGDIEQRLRGGAVYVYGFS
jgi:hypothetical protein